MSAIRCAICGVAIEFGYEGCDSMEDVLHVHPACLATADE